ncbi:MAG: M48 family metallopeptidase [Christensenellales bacterium]
MPHSKNIKIIRKNITRINLKVKSDGSVILSCPYAVADAAIQSFLASKKAWLASALAKMAQKTPVIKADDLTFESEQITFLGKNINIDIKEGGSNRALLNESGIILTVKDKNTETIRKTLLRFYKLKLRNITERFIKENILGHSEFPPCMIVYKKMRSRWGSCNPVHRKIALNTELIYAPLSCIEFIIMHEFAHFLCAGHSALFYQKLDCYMPDWKSRKKALESYAIL